MATNKRHLIINFWLKWLEQSSARIQSSWNITKMLNMIFVDELSKCGVLYMHIPFAINWKL